MTGPVDWFAVNCVMNGSRLSLTPVERRAVVRRLTEKLRDADGYHTAGKITAAELADRFRCDIRTIQRIRDELPPANKNSCPVCSAEVWVRQDSQIESHPDKLHQECPASEHLLSELDWETTTALTVMWLSVRLRAGDFVGVWDDIGRLPVRKGRELLMVALAAVPPDEDDPFWWLTGIEVAA